MKTVSSRVNEREFEAISEYANQTGETVSNVLKKVVFERAAKSKDGCPKGYRLNRLVPEGMDKDTALTKNVNKIRHIIGWDEQSTPAKKEKPTLLINDIARRIREEQAAAEEKRKNLP